MVVQQSSGVQGIEKQSKQCCSLGHDRIAGVHHFGSVLSTVFAVVLVMLRNPQQTDKWCGQILSTSFFPMGIFWNVSAFSEWNWIDVQFFPLLSAFQVFVGTAMFLKDVLHHELRCGEIVNWFQTHV